MIAGLQKMTLLDYPGKVAATVFIGGCNFRCPYCHNASLLHPANDAQEITEDTVLAFLKSRKGLLDGVCVTGGEPLLWDGLEAFLRNIKDLGFLIKLDTNGSRPAKLKTLVAQGLVDVVAMDLKHAPEKYALAAGTKADILSAVRESVEYLLSGSVPYEFRTTVVRGLHTTEDLVEIGKWIQGADAFFLQNFVNSQDVLTPGLQGLEAAELQAFADAVRPFVPGVRVRGE
ncbi:MAG TPA: anaerobic ribonucleoside-triphosphate reductase activating protein [Candidatus Limiplasma sp.]|nr:anaerobic ribonucleoside-triphosphate reductase activating protein [Candidatus Limiplasma sp.]HRX09835.1 anaerobic ribonucleoside-triphosphate reductase activating protein [Candidatus Limiplasma sp.]